MSAPADDRGSAPPAAQHSRRRSLLAVTGALVLVVAINTIVRETGVGAAARHSLQSSSLPVVQMTRPSAWRCPGPLPIGTGRERSRISIVNGGGRAVGVIVAVARTHPPGRPGRLASISTTRLEVGGESQVVLALAKRGPAGFAAVSVETEGGGIAVAESIGSTTAAGPVLVSSPCSLGVASQAYVATGSTYDRSDVRLSLYDPDATSSVVDLSVSTGTTLTSPAAYQGVVVPAGGLVVLDLRRWAPQLRTLAVTATAVSGQIAVGALESTSATVAVAEVSAGRHRVRHEHITGSSLLVGPDRGRGRWAFAAGLSTKWASDTFSVYDPGASSVSVTVAPPGRAGMTSALTAEVPAGGVVDFATPITPEGHIGSGSVTVSARGAAIVAARVTTRSGHRGLQALDATSGTAGPDDEWLLPGAALRWHVGDVITLADPGAEGATVKVLELTNGAASTTRLLNVVRLPAGDELEVRLSSVLHLAPAFAVEVLATAPILVEQQLTARHGLTTASGGIPVQG